MADRMIPRATYRLQLHAGFTFADAEKIVPYLADLGISHVYSSPVTTAAPGSMHGYDVIDPTQISPELGGEAGLRSLVAALKARDMGLIIDIVPNHMGVAGGSNAWWLDVLEHGQASQYGPVFDIDWRQPVALPVLGGPLEEVIAAGDLRLVENAGKLGLRLYDETIYPLRPDDPVFGEDAAFARHDPATEAGRAALTELAERQHYRLLFWRAANDELNWRRFFAINDLAGVRVEDPEVFERTHRLTLDLFREGLIDGVRVDHVDGLVDPAGYCRKLREELEHSAPGRRPWIVIEKILAADEPLAADWGVDGTTGYDFMREMAELLHVPEGVAPLASLWAEVSGRPADFAEEAVAARRDMLDWQFEGQLEACIEAFSVLANASRVGWLTPGMLRRAITRLLWVFPVYRTYGDGSSAPETDAAIWQSALEAARAYAAPGEAEVLDLVCDWLGGAGRDHPALASEAVRRFQQLSAPIAAKGVEDTAFYRYGALLSLNDVGFDPARPTRSIAEFHAAMAGRAADWPHAMLTTATHDQKRGEDARARLAVLSAVPEAWAEQARRWLALAVRLVPEVDRGDALMLLQTLVGAWDGASDGLLERVQEWQVKALREAQLRSSWAAPDEDYEAAYQRLAAAVLADPDFVATFTTFIARIEPAAQANSLAQTALRCLAPGVPDIYQGADMADRSLVDPDNRGEVDFALRADALTGRNEPGFGEAKLHLISRLLALRGEHAELFERGDYAALPVRGLRAGHIVAFSRRHDGVTLTCAVAVRHGAELFDAGTPFASSQWWGDTVVETGGSDRRADQLFARAHVHVEVTGS
jgi:(1->4)-alpha-D-glucan 1-alpha-D-glucosylmutase